ncbi:MAG: hypothetical protein IT509_05985 [Rhodocyclaceae bacterium]|nr:hypothetical protein [Rhodocyclaceae bacterium]
MKPGKAGRFPTQPGTMAGDPGGPQATTACRPEAPNDALRAAQGDEHRTRPG